MITIPSVNCEHVFIKKTTAESQHMHMRVKTATGEDVFHPGWKFCPVCGKEALWQAAKQ